MAQERSAAQHFLDGRVIVSTGAFGYPKDRAAAVASRAIAAALRDAKSIERVHLVFFGDADRAVFCAHQQFF